MSVAAILLLSSIGWAQWAPVNVLPDWLQQRDDVSILWQIGQLDGKPTEFALAPDRAREFAQRFGERVVFKVGRSRPADFPFIHPSEKDTAWGGHAEVPFVVQFQLTEVKAGALALLVALTDTHEQFASVLEVGLNGMVVWRERMPLGNGRAYFGDIRQSSPRLFLVPVPAAGLRVGANELTLVLRGGSWVAYDALALLEWKSAEWTPPPSSSAPDDFRAITSEHLRAKGGIVLTEKEGARVMLLPQGALTTDFSLPAHGFEVELAVRLHGGTCTIGYELPAGARGAVWALEMHAARDGGQIRVTETPLCRVETTAAPLPPTWVRLHIRHRATKTVVEVRNSGGEILRRSVLHPPTPDGVLGWRAGDAGARFDLAQLYWRALPVEESRTSRTPTAPKHLTTERGPSLQFDTNTGEACLSNGRLELLISTKEGLNPRLMRDVATGKTYADADYFWPEGKKPSLVGPPVLEKGSDGSESATFTVQLGAMEVEHAWTAPAKEPNTLTERIRLRNTGSVSLETGGFTCGMAKRLYDERGWLPDTPDSRFSAIPYRRDPETGELCEYGMSELVWRSGGYSLPWQPRLETAAYGSEGWAWCRGASTLLVIKHHPDAMEWSLLEPSWRTGEGLSQPEMVLRFGGAGRWKQGDPEEAARLEPGASFTFGVTRYQVVDGGWREAAYAFRRFMEAQGHCVPPGYNPPVHWNELYDNPLWWGPDSTERRAQFYRQADMLVEAEKAREFGCEALYLDPGWDTSFASSVWDASRLGPQEDFVKLLKEKFGLSLALHTPLAGWSDVNAYPVEARRMNREGERLNALCSAAPAYIETKASRLIELSRRGAVFLMFDGSAFTGECWDKSHGHALPLTRQEHCDAYRRLARMVHEACPSVLIEQHDPVVAGVNVRYAPTYFLHGTAGDFDELWGYEYMWDPMSDLYSGRALSLYYVNLAYSIPIYLHIDLRKDNPNALMFWWYASTCRHLGIGGKHPDPKVWEAHKRGMRAYLRLKRFYTQGVFYGLEEMVHAHTLPGEGRCVLNVFNLEDVELEREIRFRLADVGLAQGAARVEGATALVKGDEITLSVHVPPRGHQLVEVHSTDE